MAEKAKSIRELFQGISIGDKSAFNELFLSHYDRLQGFAMQYLKQEEDSEEVTSELFVKVWLRRKELDTIQNPEVYLYVSVKNACLNVLKKLGRQSMLHFDDLKEEELNFVVAASPHDLLEYKQLRSELDQVVNALPEQRRLIFKLVKEDGLKCREVAEILGISVRTVESQVYKAVKTLADQLSSFYFFTKAGK
jgi:RNA polymerase sigma-70 factor (family 1)